VIAAVIVISAVINAIFIPRYPPGTYPYNGMMGFGWGYGPFWGFGAFMMIVPLFILILFVLWIVGIARNHNGTSYYDQHQEDAMDILDRRFASGSITQEEYNKIKEQITRK
ncbi:MAG: SHOCT domain-containing protein, partial [Thermoplasmata archaeon]